MAADPRSTPTNARSHPAFILSVAFGVLGALTMVVGLVAGGQVIFEVGTAIGALSLIAALAWRADLISAWHHDHPPA